MSTPTAIGSKRDAPRTLDGEFLFQGGGESGRILREIDWSEKPVGPFETWPQSLRTALSICLSSRHPICIIWGPDRLYLYNDAYAPILGAKHPWALGESYITVWPEIWESVIKPILESVEQTGEASWCDNLLLVLQRRGFSEECYFSFSFAPTRVEDGSVGGVFTAITETTPQVVGERRLRMLRDLGTQTFVARSPEQACETASRVFSANPHDVPFALFYLTEPDGKSARLVSAFGLDAFPSARPAVISLSAGSDAVWPLGEIAGDRPLILDELGERTGPLPGGPWPEPAHTVAILPLTRAAQPTPHGFIVAGASPRRVFDSDYESFLKLAADQVATALSNVQAHAEERRRAEALAELDRAKTAFFSNVSHEFRTPLTLMLGPLEDVLTKTDGALPPAAREQIEVAHRNSLRLLKLVNTLLDFSRLEAGRMQVSYEPVDLGTITSEFASVFRSAIEKAGLEFVVDCAPSPAPVYADRDLWEKIVFNLLSNALKFTLRGRIEIRTRLHASRFTLDVHDTGVGIPEAELPNLFKRFYRIENVRSRTHEGTGIGLALVQELVKLHGGNVEVASRLGEGTQFTISIPAGKTHLPAERIQAARTLASTKLGPRPFLEESLRWLPDRPAAGSSSPVDRSAGRPRIVFAEDNADMRDYVRRLLAPHYAVEAVADGEAALAAIRREKPALVLSDVMMPVMDGFALVKSLRAEAATATLPVILLSARAGNDASSSGYDVGADDYLTKPFTERELLSRVAAHVKMARIREESTAKDAILHATEQRSEQLMHFMPVGVYVCDAQGRLIFYNRTAGSLWGLEPPLNDSAVRYCACHKVFLDGKYVPPQDTPMAMAVREGRAFRHVEATVERPDGSTFVASVNIDPISDADGNRAGAICVFQDVTERLRTQERLRAQESQLRLISSNAPIMLVHCDRDSRYLFVNQAYAMRFGVPAEDIVGRTIAEVLGADAARGLQPYIERVLAGETLDIETEIAYKKLGRRFMRFSYAPDFADDGHVRGWLSAITDITDRRLAEEALRQRAQMLEIMTRVGGALVAERDLERIVQTVTDAAREISGAAFAAFFYNAKDEHNESYTLYTLSGAPREAFAKFPMPRNTSIFGPTFRGEGVVRIADVRQDSRFGKNPPYNGMPPGHLPVRSYMAVPVISRSGEVLGGLFFGHPEADIFTESAERMVTSLAAQAAIAVDNANLYRALQTELTRQKKSEEASRRLAAIVESSDEAIISMDLDGIITSWNKGAEAILGYSAEEIVGRSVKTIVPEERPDEEDHILGIIRRGERILNHETERRRKDGSRVAISLTVSPLKTHDGRVVGASKVARDISEQKRSQLQQQALYSLVASVNRAEALTEIYAAALSALCRCQNADRAAILLCDPDRVMRFKAAHGLSDDYRRAVEGHSPWRRDEPDPQPVWIDDIAQAELDPHLRDVIDREGIRSLAFIPLTYEKRLLGKFMIYYNAPHRFTRDELRPVETIAGQVTFAIERQKSAAALEALIDERTASLREAIAQMEEFSYSVSHDLRAPVRAMRGYAEALLNDYGSRLDDEGRHLLGRIQRNGSRMDQLIQDLLTYSRLTRRELRLEPVSLDKLVREVVHQIPEMSPQHADIRILGALPDVIAHESSLGQVVSNLLSNAVKFVAPGVRPRVRIHAQCDGDLVRLWFGDNGIGIKPDQQPRLFGMFERIHPDQRYEGTGIGLAIVRKAMERMNGAVGVESDGTDGSKFWISLRHVSSAR